MVTAMDSFEKYSWKAFLCRVLFVFSRGQCVLVSEEASSTAMWKTADDETIQMEISR